jgi:hypothetical protein
LAVADISASESKKITVTDFFGNASTLIADATIPGAKIVFGSGTIPGSAVCRPVVRLRVSLRLIPTTARHTSGTAAVG